MGKYKKLALLDALKIHFQGVFKVKYISQINGGLIMFFLKFKNKTFLN